MFKKLSDKIFGGIVDLCNSVTDDPICVFGVSPENSDKRSLQAEVDENSKGIWQKVKGVGSTISRKFI